MQEEMNEYIIPENVGMSDSLGRYRIRNVIETVLATGLVTSLLWRVPFVSDLKVIVTVIAGLATFFLFLAGIKDESVGSFLAGYLLLKARRGDLRLRVAGLTKQAPDAARYRNNFEKWTAAIRKKHES